MTPGLFALMVNPHCVSGGPKNPAELTYQFKQPTIAVVVEPHKKSSLTNTVVAGSIPPLPPLPLAAAVIRPFPSTVILAAVNDPTLELTVASTFAELTPPTSPPS